MNARVDAFISRAGQWQKEMEKLRKLLLGCGLTEELKWGKPCYAYEGKNIAIIQPFKEYFALLFFKGYLMSDPGGILVKTGENTVVGRQIRLADAREIVKLEKVLKAYIYQAIEVEKAGVKAPAPKSTDLKLPEEFKTKLAKDPALKSAFYALTPGRQKAYNIYFSQPKQPKTRESRIEKYVKQILNGKGIND